MSCEIGETAEASSEWLLFLCNNFHPNSIRDPGQIGKKATRGCLGATVIKICACIHHCLCNSLWGNIAECLPVCKGKGPSPALQILRSIDRRNMNLRKEVHKHNN